jgi:hypothetical protein
MKRVFQYITGLFSEKKPAPVPEIKSTDYSGLYNRDNFFPGEFYSNLIRTINWTEKIMAGIDDVTKINYATILRSTNPVYEGTPFYRYKNTTSGYPQPQYNPFNYVALLKEALAYKKDTFIYFRNMHESGQILEFEIDVTTYDGAPCTATDGFIDESDIPPIDTWFYITTTKLYCWIPNFFVRKMQDAIEVEILGSYNWIKDSKPVLYFQSIERLNAAYNKQVPGL